MPTGWCSRPQQATFCRNNRSRIPKSPRVLSGRCPQQPLIVLRHAPVQNSDVSSLIVDLDSQQAPAPPRDLASRLEPRIGVLHLRQRLGIEDDHEKIYGHDVNSDRLENSRLPALARHCRI